MHLARIWNLWIKKRNDEASEEELEEFNKFLSSNPSSLYILQLFNKIWDSRLKEPVQVTDKYLDKRWSALLGKIEVQASKPKRRAFTWVAAAVFVFAVSSVLFYSYLSTEVDGKNNVVSTRNGSRTKIDLPDGSQVWLNSGSRIIYEESFSKVNRELTLVGEAFFDVTEDKDHPFVIHTSLTNIKVLGTTFNVRAYKEEKRTEASLITGKIEISFPKRPSLGTLVLKPNEKIVVRDDTEDAESPAKTIKDKSGVESEIISLSNLSYAPADSMVLETSWVQNILSFKNKKFEEVASSFERWYNVKIIFRNEKLKLKRFSGVFKNETIEEALTAMKLSYGFNFKIDKKTNTVIIDK